MGNFGREKFETRGYYSMIKKYELDYKCVTFIFFTLSLIIALEIDSTQPLFFFSEWKS